MDAVMVASVEIPITHFWGVLVSWIACYMVGRSLGGARL